MARTFSLTPTVDSPSLVARAKKMANETGATLVGDEKAGRFSDGMLRGEYRVVGDTVLVTITDKPWMVPWAIVESQLREFVR